MVDDIRINGQQVLIGMNPGLGKKKQARGECSPGPVEFGSDYQNNMFVIRRLSLI